MTDAVPDDINRRPKKNRVKKFLLITLLLVILGCITYYFICGMTYSEGTRSGVLIKVSKKGFVFKTYEGELNVGGLNQGDGTIMPVNIFTFSVRDKDVYEQLEELQGRRVVLGYKQVMKNFFWQGETDYFVYRVNIVK
jgi:hypothetical protein